jgi:hypothetical protein
MELLVETRVALDRDRWKREEKESEKLGGGGLYRAVTAAGASRSLASKGGCAKLKREATRNTNVKKPPGKLVLAGNWRCLKATR